MPLAMMPPLSSSFFGCLLRPPVAETVKSPDISTALMKNSRTNTKTKFRWNSSFPKAIGLGTANHAASLMGEKLMYPQIAAMTYPTIMPPSTAAALTMPLP